MNDVRFALRSLRRRPGLATALVATTALGIGAASVIFTLMNAALLRPLPYRHPQQLVQLWETHGGGGAGISEASYPDFLDWRAQAGAFAGLEGYDPTNITVTGSGTTEMLQGAHVTAGFFDLLGVAPVLGRAFRRGEDAPGAADVVVLGNGYWHRAFGGDRDVLGRSLVINGRAHQIIGVLPRSFFFAPVGNDADLWLPVDRAASTRAARGNHWLNVVGRLRNGADPQVARRQLGQIMDRLATAYPETNGGRGIGMAPLRGQITGDATPILRALFAGVVLLLLIACFNVANLLLARSVSRTQELAIRAAIGASRTRLAQQLLTESLLISVAGAALGLVIAEVGVPALVAVIPHALVVHTPYLRTARPDALVLAFSAALAVVTGFAFGAVPALAGSRREAAGAALVGARRATVGGARVRMRDLLVAGELALTVALLAGVGIVGRSLWHLLQENPGFAVERQVTARIALAGPRYQTPGAQQRFFEQLLEQVRELPGVRAVGAVSKLPLNGGGTNTFRVEGLPAPEPAHRPEAITRGVAGDYFRAMGIPLLAGRAFTARDDSTTQPVIIINESLATRLFGRGRAVGRRFRFYALPDVAWEVVGVVGDVKTTRLDATIPPTVYTSVRQSAENRLTLVVRTTSAPGAFADRLRAMVRNVDPGVPVYALSTLENVVANSPAVAARRFPLLLISVFGIAGLLLAAVGVYGVTAHAVAQRARELGIRAALGATGTGLVRLVLRHAAVLAVGGTVAGGLLALVFGRLLRGLLYHVQPIDLLSLMLAAGALAVITFGASAAPAYRAARADPMEVLRDE